MTRVLNRVPELFYRNVETAVQHVNDALIPVCGDEVRIHGNHFIINPERLGVHPLHQILEGDRIHDRQR